MANERQRCFVIMPFSKTTDKHTKDYWTKHFRNFLKPLVEENPKLEAHRSQPLRGDIIRQIITDLVVCRVVVADLTDQNPNVYWELGVRQSFKHGTVTIAEVGTPLPFDIGGKGTLFYYPKDHLEMEDFRKDFKEAVQDCLTNPDRPDSHVLETLSGRGTLFQIFHRDEALRRLDAVLSECDRNLVVLKIVLGTAEENQKNPGKRTYVTGRLRVPAAELLITNRYVDEDQSFYESAEYYVSRMVMWCEQLNLWEYSPDRTEQWLLKNKEMAEKSLTQVRNKVMAARDKVSRQF